MAECIIFTCIPTGKNQLEKIMFLVVIYIHIRGLCSNLVETFLYTIAVDFILIKQCVYIIAISKIRVGLFGYHINIHPQ